MIWVGLAWAWGNVALACEGEGEGLDVLLVSLEEAGNAGELLDQDGLHRAVDTALTHLKCIDRPVPTALVARLHLALGLDAYGRRDSKATAAFAAARRADQTLNLPDAFPDGSAVGRAFRFVNLDQVETSVLPPPRKGRIYLDGRATRQRAVGLPMVFQHFDERGQLLDARYLDGTTTPEYPSRDLKRQRKRIVLGLSAGAGAVTAVTLGGLAAERRSQFFAPETPDEELPGLKRQNNRFTAASWTVAALTAGTAATLAIAW